jgi:adenosylmethionine-8-amino-7-oxononanoate aminotransferase
VGAAIAHANLDIMEQERLPENAARIGAYLIDRLRSKLAEHPLVGEIRGRGLLIGVELDGDRATRRPFAEPHRVASLVSRACFEERLLVRGGHGRVLAALAPPLIATVGDADEIVARLGRVLDRVAGEAKQAGLSA